MKPFRVQRKRTKGWRMPANTIYVGRPTKFGNPYKPVDYLKSLQGVHQLQKIPTIDLTNSKFYEFCVDAFKHYIESNPELMSLVKKELKGRNLSCFCPLDQPCHADMLLEIANN